MGVLQGGTGHWTVNYADPNFFKTSPAIQCFRKLVISYKIMIGLYKLKVSKLFCQKLKQFINKMGNLFFIVLTLQTSEYLKF